LLPCGSIIKAAHGEGCRKMFTSGPGRRSACMSWPSPNAGQDLNLIWIRFGTGPPTFTHSAPESCRYRIRTLSTGAAGTPTARQRSPAAVQCNTYLRFNSRSRMSRISYIRVREAKKAKFCFAIANLRGIIRRKLIYNQIFKLPFTLCRWIGPVVFCEKKAKFCGAFGRGRKKSKVLWRDIHTVRAWTPTDLTSQDCAQMRRKIKRSHPRMPFRDRMLTQLASDPSRTYGKHRRSLLSG
jgi:hypothetical protein